MPAVFSEPQSIQVSGTLRNDGSSTVYYRDEYPVSASVNDGSLTQGASVALNGVQWIACAAGERSFVTVVSQSGVSAIVKLTQAAYDALGAKDATTLYVIVG